MKWFNIIWLSFTRLDPRYQFRNPVMFIVYLGSILTTILGIYSFWEPRYGPSDFVLHIACWLWLTSFFSNFSEAIAEYRGKAQAETLKKSREDIVAKYLKNLDNHTPQPVTANMLKKGDYVLVEAGDIIPADGEAIQGVASIDESAITGESAPVIREAGSDHSSVIAGTVVLSDSLIIQITSEPGGSFLDHMIALVEGAKRKKTPNEIALQILLAGMSLIFLLTVYTFYPFSTLETANLPDSQKMHFAVLIALLVCLIPTTIGGLLSAIGIAGMDRLIRCNVIANSGRAVEAAGDVNILLLDKTGTITLGNRQAIAFYPADNIPILTLAQACELSSLMDETPEGKSIVALAREKYEVKKTLVHELQAEFIPFSAETRLSGIILKDNIQILKGAVDQIHARLKKSNQRISAKISKKIEEIARLGGTPLLVLKNDTLLGLIELKDIIKPGIKARLAELRKMGVKSIMITGDNPITAATIANEAGVDDFYAESTPEEKLTFIRNFQENGQLVAMVGDGTNDAPALAQTDVAVAMNTGTQAAKEAANMIDLDSDPTKIIEIIKIGKQLLVTRGALTTFSLSNDVAKYFTIIPAIFSGIIPGIEQFDVMKLHTPESAILSAVIFNSIIIVFLIPLALHGVKFYSAHANTLLRRNIFQYGLGGLLLPFVGIKLIDILIGKLLIL